MRLFLLLFSIVFVLFSCNEERAKGSFSNKELGWLVYAENDSIVFRNEAGKTETVHVIHRTDLEQIKQYFPIEAEVILSDIDSVKSFRIYLLKDKNSFKRYLRIGEVYRPLDLIKPVSEMEINGMVYKNVFELAEDTVKQKPNIWRALYNKDYGIIQYTNLRNQTFTMIATKE